MTGLRPGQISLAVGDKFLRFVCGSRTRLTVADARIEEEEEELPFMLHEMLLVENQLDWLTD